jgi:hypothetical protein
MMSDMALKRSFKLTITARMHRDAKFCDALRVEFGFALGASPTATRDTALREVADALGIRLRPWLN